MASELIAVGTTLANSSDVVVAAGTPVTVSLYEGAAAGCRVMITLKDGAGGYNMVDELTAYKPAIVLVGPGSYRLTRVAGASCGVFSG